MAKNRKPLKRSILLGIVIFVIALCVAISCYQYLQYNRMLYEKYEAHIENVLNYAEACIDVDDLERCIETGKESEKFKALQKDLDRIKENVELDFIYVIVPLNTHKRDNIKNVIAGVSQWEYREIPDQLMYLNMLTGDSYSPAEAKKYLDAYRRGKLTFFENITEWGDDYTGMKTLYDSKGNKVAALCVDVNVASIHRQVRNNTAVNVAIILLIGLVATLLFILWTDRNVTRPLEELEASVTRFALDSSRQHDPEALILHIPEIHTENEVESLAHAVLKMSEDMRDYVASVLFTEAELARVNMMATRDALTHVGNKAGYDQYIETLKRDLQEEKEPFAVILMDTNGLKHINDTYGHEKGNLYLVQCCRVICKVFAHSPVFRIGGDEFTVLLRGADYENREALIEEARRRYREKAADDSVDPWERASASLGMAEYDPAREETIDEVVDRADQNMYKEKEKEKNNSL